MELTVQELAALVGGQFAFDANPTAWIRGAASVEDAEEGQVTFLSNPRYLPQLKESRATAALVPRDFIDKVGPITIQVENPSLAFAQLLERFAPPSMAFKPGVHPSAVLGENVQLGEGSSIQPHAVVESGARIGARTVIGAHAYIGHEAQIGTDCQVAPHVTIGARCTVGNRVILHSGVVLGSDGFGFEFVGGRHVKIPQTGIVQLDDDVEVGANTTIDRARFNRTWIGEGTKIDNLVQIAHNVIIGKHCIIVAQTGIAGSSRLGDYVTMGGQAAVTGHVKIGDRVMVGARGGISKDVAAGQVMWGSPATSMQQAKEQLVALRRLPKLLERINQLEQTCGAKGELSTDSPTLLESPN